MNSKRMSLPEPPVKMLMSISIRCDPAWNLRIKCPSQGPGIYISLRAGSEFSIYTFLSRQNLASEISENIHEHEKLPRKVLVPAVGARSSILDPPYAHFVPELHRQMQNLSGPPPGPPVPRARPQAQNQPYRALLHPTSIGIFQGLPISM